MKAKCWAYTEQGTIGGKPAIAVDAVRGYTVCQDHLPQKEPTTQK